MLARFTGINRWPRLFFCVTDWQDTIALLLGTASASITLDGSQFFATADQAASKMDMLAGYGGKGGPTFFDNLTRGAVLFGAAVAGPMAMGVRGAIALEDAVVGVGASLGNIDGSTLEELSDLFLEVGANSQFSATEVAGVADALAKAGFDEVDLLGGMVEQVVMLSQATGEGLGPATAGITQAFNMWSEAVVGSELAMTDATRAADILTIASNQSAGGINDVIGGLTNAGPALAGVGLGFDDAAAAIAYFTNFGYSGSEVGTKLSRTLTMLANPTAEAATLLNDLGISAFDLEGNFVGFPALFDQLQTGFAGMGDEARLAALKVIFGAEAFDLMNIATQTGGEGLLEFMGLFDQTGVAAEQSATRMNTVAAKFDALKEGIGSFFTSLVTGLLPGFHLGLDLANAFVDALMRIPDPIKTIIGAFSGLLAIIATITIGSSVFGAISTMLGGIGISAGGAAAALGTFVAPIVAIGAAVAGLYLVWKTNFLGLGSVIEQGLAPVFSIADTIQTGFQGIGSFVDRFVKAFNRIEGPAKAAGDAMETFAGPVEAARKGFNAVASMAGKASKPIAAFAKGFEAVSAAAYDVLGPFIGVAEAGGRFADTFRRAFTPLERIAGGLGQLGGAASTASDAVTTLGRVFDALAFAINGINGGDIPVWLEDVADFFSAASESADEFFKAFEAARNITLMDGGSALEAFTAGIRNALGTIDIGSIAIRVGSWLITAASDLWGAITSWVSDVALPAAGQAARTIYNVAIGIGSWAKGTITDLWPYVRMWAGDAIAAIPGAAATLWGVIVNVGSWAQGIVSDIWPYITMWTTSAMEGASGTAGTLWGVIVNIGSWAAGEIASLSEWLAVQIFGEDFTAPGATAATKLMAAISTAFSAGKSVGAIFDIGASVMTWINDQIVGADIDLTHVGERIGNALAAALTRVFASGLVFTTIGPSFSAGLSSAIADEIEGGNFTDQFWASFENLAEVPATLFAGVAEGFVNGLITEIAPEGSVDLGPISFDLGELDFAEELTDSFKSSFIDSVIPLSTVDVGDVIADIGSVDISGITKEDFAKAFIDAVVPGGTLIIEGFEIAFGDGEGDGDSGGKWSGFGESMGLAVTRGFSQAWLDFARNILPNLIPGGGGGGFELPAVSIDTSGVAASLDDVKARLSTIGADVQGAFNVPIDTSIFTGGLESAKASLVDLATTAQMQSLAMAMAGLEMGRAFVTGVQASISAGAGQVAGAITALMAPAQSSRAQMALYGINAGLGYGTGVAAGIRSQTGAVASAAAAYLAVVSGYRGAMMAAGLGIGAALGQGIAAGIRSQIGAVAAAAAAMVSTAVSAARAAGGIQSPSTVMRDQVGMNLALGTAEGILAGLPAIYRAANRMVYIPDVPNRGFAGAGGASVTHVTTIHAPVTVEGNVTTEDNLITNAATRISDAIVNEVQRKRTAVGVS